MVSPKQKFRIKTMMQRIKEAKNSGKSKEEIKRRTQELYNYLEEQGIVLR